MTGEGIALCIEILLVLIVLFGRMQNCQSSCLESLLHSQFQLLS